MQFSNDFLAQLNNLFSMIGYRNYSTWGIKDSGNDITNDILNIIRNANQFIIVGGYNFSYQTNGASIIPLLQNQISNNIPVLIILPPNLFGASHKPMIRYCLQNNISVILNHNNHSKWLLTDQDLYYGSSNFTNTSWRDRIEVVSLHRLSRFHGRGWQPWTIQDFLNFVQLQINNINRRTSMANYSNSRTMAINTWTSILHRVQRLNPDKEKVQNTLKIYENISLELSSIIEEIFLTYSTDTFDFYDKHVNMIQKSFNELCMFGYDSIANELLVEIDPSEEAISEYNNYHDNLKQKIEEAIKSSEKFEHKQTSEDRSYIEVNSSQIALIYERLIPLIDKDDRER